MSTHIETKQYPFGFKLGQFMAEGRKIWKDSTFREHVEKHNGKRQVCWKQPKQRKTK